MEKDLEQKENLGLFGKLPKERQEEIKKEVEELKVKHKTDKIMVFVAENKGDKEIPFYVAYFRQPKALDELGRYVMYVQDDIIAANYELAKMCFVGGNKEMLNESVYVRTGLYTWTSELMASSSSELKAF